MPSNSKARHSNGRQARRRSKQIASSGDRTDHALQSPIGQRQGWFTWFALETARLSGRPATFLIAVTLIVVWGITGPLFRYSDTWQLVINTGTTIVTFLMVFLIQNTQNRDTLALQIKLAELIIAMRGAHNKVADHRGPVR